MGKNKEGDMKFRSKLRGIVIAEAWNEGIEKIQLRQKLGNKLFNGGHAIINTGRYMEDSAKGERWTFEHTCQIQLHNTRETK